MSEERRRFPRIPLLAEAWLVVGDQRVHVQTKDLSLGGACLEMAPGSAEPLKAQSPCVLEIRLPNREELHINAQLAWVRARTAGVRFSKISKDALAALEAELERSLEEFKSLEDEKTPS